jgi:hypothetical protein
MQTLFPLQLEQVEKECIVSFIAVATPHGVLEKQQSIYICPPETAGAKIPPSAISATQGHVGLPARGDFKELPMLINHSPREIESLVTAEMHKSGCGVGLYRPYAHNRTK